MCAGVPTADFVPVLCLAMTCSGGVAGVDIRAGPGSNTFPNSFTNLVDVRKSHVYHI